MLACSISFVLRFVCMQISRILYATKCLNKKINKNGQSNYHLTTLWKMECVRNGSDTSLRHALPHAAPKMQMAPAGSCMATLSQCQHVGEITVTVAECGFSAGYPDISVTV